MAEVAASATGAGLIELRDLLIDRRERLFEDFCVVTESVRRGIPVDVKITSHAEAARARE